MREVLLRTCLLPAAVCALLGGCELSDCVRFPPSSPGSDREYSPRSASVRLVDADTGEPVCSSEDMEVEPEVTYNASATGDGGPQEAEETLYPYEDPADCLYQFPGWERVARGRDAVLKVPGYEPLEIDVELTDDDACGVPIVPDLLEYELTPSP